MNIIRYWNDLSLRLVADDHTGSPAPANQGGPTRTSYALAMLHLAMHDTVAGIDGSFAAYATTPVPAPAGSQQQQAASSAANYMALHLYPSHAAMIDTAFQAARNLLGVTGTFPTASEQYGIDVAEALIDQRLADGTKTFEDYHYQPDPGAHRPDPTSPGQSALGPEWGKVTPFTYAAGAHPSLPAPPPLLSKEYLAAYNEVITEGRDDLSRRKPQQAMKGIFWGYDGAQKLGTPPRLYNQVVRAITDPLNLAEVEEVRLLTLVNVGMADAGIACWHHKYVYNFWRPVVGIREAAFGAGPSGLGDTAKATDGDPFWLPLGAPDSNGSRGKNFTPGFPAYPSGHSTFGATCFLLLAKFLGKHPKDVKFEFVSDEFNGVSRDTTGIVRPRLRRWFTLAQAIEENADSRIYLGVHWKFDATQGIKLGEALVPKIYSKLGSPKAPKTKAVVKAAAPAPAQQAIPGWRDPHR